FTRGPNRLPTPCWESPIWRCQTCWSRSKPRHVCPEPEASSFLQPIRVTHMSKKHRVNWKGYIPTTITPFDEARQLDVPALHSMLEWLHAQGMHGLFVGGTTSEWTSLSNQERVELFRASADAMRGKLPLLAGCTGYTPAEVVALAQEAQALGYEGVVIAPPPYVRPNDKEILAFYQQIAKEITLPIVIYNWPAGTGIDLSVDLLEQLSDIDGVVGIKQSSPSIEQFIKTLFRLKDKVRVYGFRMDEHG